MSKKWIIILFILIMSLTFFVMPRNINDEKHSNVTVFVIDKNINSELVKGPLKSLGSEPGHGSMVTWIIRSEAPGVLVKPLSISEEIDPFETSLLQTKLDKIIKYKRKNPQKRVLVNISLGFEKPVAADRVKKLAEQGVKIIAAAGNNDSKVPVYPAGFAQVVAVANADSEGKATSSNYGDFIDIGAPGDIEYIDNLYFPSQTLTRKYEFIGTSFSAPRVTGVLAELLSLSPSLKVDKALEIIYKTSSPIKSNLFEEGKLGAGILTKKQALQEVTPANGINWVKWMKYLTIILLVAVVFKYIWQKFSVFSFFVFILLILFTMPLALGLGPPLYQTLQLRDILYGLLIFITGYFAGIGLIILLTDMIERPNLLIKLIYFPNNMTRSKIRERMLALIKDKPGKEYYAKIVDILLDSGPGLKRHFLIKLMCKTKKPPLGAFLYLIYNSKIDVKFIGEQLKKGQLEEKCLIKRLKEFLELKPDQYRSAAAKLLPLFNENKIVVQLKDLLASSDQTVLIHVLRVFAKLKQENSKLAEEIKEIIKDQNNDMWLRYYAVKAYINTAQRDIEFYNFINKLKSDKQELVRLEAESIIQ